VPNARRDDPQIAPLNDEAVVPPEMAALLATTERLTVALGEREASHSIGRTGMSGSTRMLPWWLLGPSLTNFLRQDCLTLCIQSERVSHRSVDENPQC
jgi:hypothetical protein